MNPEKLTEKQNEIFEDCDSVQTTLNDFEGCDSNQTKTGRGGKRLNSGKKSSGIETVTVRIDKRLLNTVTEIKDTFKTTQSLDDIISKPQSKNDDAKLLKKIAKLERLNNEIREGFLKFLESERQAHKAEIEQLNEQNNDAELLRKNTALNNVNKHLCDCLENEKKKRVDEVKRLGDEIKRLESSNRIFKGYIDSNDLKIGGLDDKLRKRLIQYCHPDGVQDARKKAIAEDLTKALNGLAS